MIGRAFAPVLVLAVAGAVGACAARQPTASVPPPTTAAAQPGTVTAEPAEGYAAQPGAPGGRGAAAMQGRECTTAIGGTRVRTVHTPRGVNITFTTSVPELRRRVRSFAHRMNVQSGGGAATGRAMRMGGTTMGMPPVHTRVEDVPGGARIHVTPLDASRLGALRQAWPQGVTTVRGGCVPISGPGAGAP